MKKREEMTERELLLLATQQLENVDKRLENHGKRIERIELALFGAVLGAAAWLGKAWAKAKGLS